MPDTRKRARANEQMEGENNGPRPPTENLALGLDVGQLLVAGSSSPVSAGRGAPPRSSVDMPQQAPAAGSEPSLSDNIVKAIKALTKTVDMSQEDRERLKERWFNRHNLGSAQKVSFFASRLCFAGCNENISVSVTDAI